MANSSQKSVLISGGYLGLGGVQTHLELLCRLLLKHNFRVDLVATDCKWPQENLQALKKAGVRIIIPPRFLRLNSKFSGLMTLLICCFRLNKSYGCLYTIGTGQIHLYLRRLRPKLFSLFHEIVTPTKHDPNSKLCIEAMHAVIANSRPVKEVMQQQYPDKPYRILRFLVNERNLEPPARPPYDPSKPMQVTFLGRLAGHKRPDKLAYRWKDLTATGPLKNARFHIYGWGNEMHDEIKDWVEKNGMGEQVKLHGHYKMETLPQILAQSDLVVLPSTWEGLPLVLVEAMTHGVPIAACAAGGSAEFMDDNPDAIVTSKDWEDFEAGLLSMAQRICDGQVDPLRLHHWAESRYGYPVVSQEWVKLLSAPRAYYGLTSN